MPRRLSDDERRIWDHVRRSIRPMKRARLHAQSAAKRQEHERQEKPLTTSPAPLPASHRNASPIYVHHKPVLPLDRTDGMARTTRRSIKRGTIEPTARLDLHGDPLEIARTRMRGFLASAAASGHRCVLIITGKGGARKSTDFGVEYSGVIRRAFPEWMHDPELGAYVSHYTPAHAKHGGDGAWYVFIRARVRR